MIRPLLTLSGVIILVLILTSAFSTMAASNSIPKTGISQHVRAITANDLKPPECAGITVTNKVSGTGSFSGTDANDLIIGSAAADLIVDINGNDCILGGGGDDTLEGGLGDDVILGGPGNDAIDGGLGTDICYGGPGLDTFAACETSIQ